MTNPVSGSDPSNIVDATNLDNLEVPDFPKASASLREQMVAYFHITNPTEEDYKMIDGLVYQMQMSAYNYLKSVFEKSREGRKEAWREEEKSRRA